MNLYLLRHAIAAERGSPGIGDDSQRELTSEGAAKMRRIARGMLKLDLQFDLILSSPYLRTRQTADIVADVFEAREVLRFTDNLVPGAGGEQVVAEINKQYRKRENILLVGHEPTLSSLISMLVSGDPTLDITMKKGGLCSLTIAVLTYGRCATLDWLMYPSQLALLGGK
jgi:phosphohistidine phosphatase